MTDPRIATKLLAAGRFVENLGHQRPAITEHYTRERRRHDGYTSSGLGHGDGRSNNTDTTVERAVIKRVDDLDASLADIEAGERLLLITIADLKQSYDRFLGIRAPDPIEESTFDRCKGFVGQPCMEHAGDHHDPDTQQAITTLCSSCFARACTICHDRPTDNYRVDGRKSCEACYRRDLRRRHTFDAA